MSQLWRRAVNIAKSYINDAGSAFSSQSNAEDEELRRIIDEISRENAADEAERKQSGGANSSSRKGGQSNERRQQSSDGSMTLADACKVLEIPSTADVKTIKKAYKRLIGLYHPDRVATEDEKVRDVAAKRSREINRAYAFLKKVHNFR